MNDATQRLFFALWPDASASGALETVAQQVAVECRGRATAPGNIHVTLVFLGDQPPRIALELSAAAGRISVPAFDLIFDRVQSWKKSAIVWAGVRDVPAPLTALHESLSRVLEASGIDRDDRPFAVHVTLVRGAETMVRRPLPSPLTWHVSGFALVESKLSSAGPRYRVLFAWPLIEDPQPRGDAPHTP